MISGAQVMVNCLEQEGVSVVFGYPGAAICPFFDSLYGSGVQAVLVRQEQNAGHAASGYARASHQVGVCVVTSGPGATNLITAIATAYMDSIPMVAVTGQVSSELLGRDVFQEVDITGACEPFTKHSYLVKKTADLPRVFKEAFHVCRTGRPGPVLIDVPLDIQLNTIKEFTYPEKAEILGYKPSTTGHAVQVQRGAQLIAQSKKPVICAGGGVISANAKQQLRAFAEKTNIPVVTTMMGLGVMPTEHPLNLGMLGTHGVKAANKAIANTDLLILCGARVGDRALAKAHQVAQRAKVLHIDVDPAEIGKNMRADIPIVGDIRLVLDALCGMEIPPADTAWTDITAEWKTANQREREPVEGYVQPRRLLKILSKKMGDTGVLVADVGQNQIWCANAFTIENHQFFTTGGLGTMGYAIPAAVGAKRARPELPVVAVCGDGSFQMSMMELATMCQHQIAAKVIVMKNNRLGMVRELQDNLYHGVHAITMLDGSPSITGIARAYGMETMSISSEGEVDGAIDRLLEKDAPFLLECVVNPDEPSL